MLDHAAAAVTGQAGALLEGQYVGRIRGASRLRGIRLRPRGSTPRRRGRALALVAGAVGLVAITTGCQSTTFTRLGLLRPLTKQGQTIVTLWQGSWIAAFCVGAVVWGLILWAVMFHRKRDDRPPYQVRYNLPIEVVYTVVPFIMIGVLFFFTARDENSINSVSAKPGLIVNVTGFQWSWEFQYPQYRVHNPANGNVVTELGQMWNGQTPGNKTQLPLLEVPVGEVVQFNLKTTDVIHSFWIVPFEFKRDLIPGHPNHFQVTPTATGSSIGRCSELCGIYHSRMLFRVKVVTKTQFERWIRGQQALQNHSGGVS